MLGHNYLYDKSMCFTKVARRNSVALLEWKRRDQPYTGPALLRQKIVTDHDPSDDLGNVDPDFDLAPQADIKSLRDWRPRIFGFLQKCRRPLTSRGSWRFPQTIIFWHGMGFPPLPRMPALVPVGVKNGYSQLTIRLASRHPVSMGSSPSASTGSGGRRHHN